MDAFTGLTVTPVLAAALGLMLAALGLLTIRMRYRERVSVGDGGSPAMLRAMRAHANFAEYAPLILVLLVILELNGESAGALHGLGWVLILGRCMHAFGFSREGAHALWRTGGMVLTFLVLLTASARLAFMALSG